QSCAHQESRPIDAVKADDVLAYRMKIGRPEGCEISTFRLGITERRDVVRERVEPHIDDMARIARHRNAPGEAGARDRQVAQAALDEADHFVRRARGAMKSGLSS